MSELQAVLFDMDGTICDTEPLWMAAEFAMAERYGAQWTPHDCLQLVGQALPTSAAYIRDRMQLDLTPDQIVDELIDGVCAAIIETGADWRPGALELLQECNEAGLPTALVTMAYRRFAAAVVDAMHMGRFDVTVTGDEVERGKPAPDAYLKAAELLGVDPESSIAIEDSPSGADAGESAGCLVITVPNHVQIPLTAQRRQRASLTDVSVGHLQHLMAHR